MRLMYAIIPKMINVSIDYDGYVFAMTATAVNENVDKIFKDLLEELRAFYDNYKSPEEDDDDVSSQD